ncbi:nijmegen breakage syndrome 1 protein [Impatiens glandulifera]|uniref:nijmegen breakage syndrome 1 protein n=1 Tax=Impatiens glandulifera TaxID=253017 RepID=UPI001FB08970|nr:nijmegen breakage syndrome 1 protein [Impatiens glandulifera]
MVWGLFPADPLSGEDRYYIFRKGTYKVGRKGCDVIVKMDKGVSRVHAEILVDEMTSSDNLRNINNEMSSQVRLRDCSKYGTFVTKKQGVKEKVQEFPGKEITLKDGDLVSFGTGSAMYRFCHIPLVFFIYSSQTFDEDLLLEEKLLSIGAHITRGWHSDCTHVLVDQVTRLTKDAVDAFVAKKPFVLKTWVEIVSEKSISTEFPSCSPYTPTFLLDGVSVKLAEPRENCLKGFTFLLEPVNRYLFEDKLRSLLEMVGAKVLSLEGFCANSQGMEDEENRSVYVIPCRTSEQAKSPNNQRTLSRVKETDLIVSAFSGQFDPSIVMSEAVIISSSCSTDETIVAESEDEQETAASMDICAAQMKRTEEVKEEFSAKAAATSKLESVPVEIFRSSNNSPLKKKQEVVDEPEMGNSYIIYSQNLVIRDTNSPSSSSVRSLRNNDNGIPNFKCFRKPGIPSGNSFNNLVPFSKYPYRNSEYEAEEVIESVKEEKKRKQMEAVAEDLFNNQKARKRGVTGSIHGLLTSG